MSTYEISKSSLLSLKAEILRKQEDLAKTKQENAEKIKSIKKKSLELKNKGIEARQSNDLDSEEQDLLKLSKSTLEAKAKLYDKLAKSSQQDEDTKRRYLVRFDKKNKVSEHYTPSEDDEPDLPPHSDTEDEEKYSSDYYDEDADPNDQWVEYTDCLGRSRKCLKKDLKYFMSKDDDLKALAEKRQQAAPSVQRDNLPETHSPEPDKEEAETPQNNTEDNENEMISGDMRREMLREQWEREEDELTNKKDIHYQNILFDEARQHGVGYYAFSKDEEERAKQQEALKQLRTETEQQQKRAQDQKALREKQMALRMKAARNRRRARMGLPPEEDDVSATLPTPEESEEEKKKKKEEEKQAEKEKLLAEARKRHVRPWDVGKEGSKEFYQMTQTEWNEKKRKERPSEFAPPKAYNSREFSSMKSLEVEMPEGRRPLKFSTLENNKIHPEKRKLRNINPYKNSNSDDSTGSDDSNLGSNKPYEPDDPSSDVEDALLQDYRKTQSTPNKIEPTLIVNEINDPPCSDFREQSVVPDHEKTNKFRNKGTEIAPPSTYEYYNSTQAKRPENFSGQINISESIEAGLKFLRSQAERKKRRFDDP